MRTQSEAAPFVRAGLRARYPQRRIQGPQLHERAARSHTIAAEENQRVPAGVERATVHHNRTAARNAAVQRVYACHARLKSLDSSDRRRYGAGRGAAVEQFAAEGASDALGRYDIDARRGASGKNARINMNYFNSALSNAVFV